MIVRCTNEAFSAIEKKKEKGDATAGPLPNMIIIQKSQKCRVHVLTAN